MILIGLGFVTGFGSFLAGLHYSHIKIENQKDYKDYYKSLIISRYLSVLFFVLGAIKLLFMS
jgi:hypothetical protein